MVSRTGWTAELGYEVYLRDSSRALELWDAIMAAGEEFELRVIAPSDQRRMEAGIFNYGNDMDVTNNPYEVTGLERLVELDNDNQVVVARALERIRRGGRHPEAGGGDDRRRAARDVAGGFWPVASRARGRASRQRVLLAAPRAQHGLRLGADRAAAEGSRIEIDVPRGTDDGHRDRNALPGPEEGDPGQELKSGAGVATLQAR